MSLSFMIFLYVFLIATALVISAINDILSAVITLSVFGILLATAFAILQAPDVAIAEAGIGAGLTTAIFIIAIRGTQRHEGPDQ